MMPVTLINSSINRLALININSVLIFVSRVFEMMFPSFRFKLVKLEEFGVRDKKIHPETLSR